MYNNTSTPIKITLNKFISLFLLSVAVSGCYDETMVAGGPGTGGTGPIIITSSNEHMTAYDDVSSINTTQDTPITLTLEEEAAIYDELVQVGRQKTKLPTHTKQETIKQETPTSSVEELPTYTVEATKKSVDNQICGNFKRSISLITEDGNTTDSLITNTTQLKLQVTVTNLSDEEQVEIQNDCHSFRAIDNNGNDVNTINDNLDGCEISTQDLLFLPKQQHNYQLTLDNADSISPLTIEYINQVNDIEKTKMDGTKVADDCNTFIELKTTQ